jgi:DNA-binding SARP family transcriptional activator
MEEAIGTVRLWVRHAPSEEAAQRRLMELLSSAGESERALVAYEGFRNTLGRAPGSEPSSQMQELAARLREEVEERASLGASLLRPTATPTITTQARDSRKERAYLRQPAPRVPQSEGVS